MFDCKGTSDNASDHRSYFTNKTHHVSSRTLCRVYSVPKGYGGRKEVVKAFEKCYVGRGGAEVSELSKVQLCKKRSVIAVRVLVRDM